MVEGRKGSTRRLSAVRWKRRLRRTARRPKRPSEAYRNNERRFLRSVMPSTSGTASMLQSKLSGCGSSSSCTFSAGRYRKVSVLKVGVGGIEGTRWEWPDKRTLHRSIYVKVLD